ncbi:hypothetical protein QTP88_022944 [Uroleucon formosanum]
MLSCDLLNVFQRMKIINETSSLPPSAKFGPSSKSFWNAMNWTVIIFSSLLLLEMKLGLHAIHLKPRDSPNSGVTPLQKNHSISVLGPQRHHFDLIFTSGGDHQRSKEGSVNERSLLAARQRQTPHGQCDEAIVGPNWMGCFEPPPVFPPIWHPSDYHLFTSLKKHMGGKKFSTDVKVNNMKDKVDKGDGGRVLRGRHKKNNLPSHNLH